MTELSFLVDLLLNHRLPKATKDAVAARIKHIEQARTQPVMAAPLHYGVPSVAGANQSPSTLAAMARHAEQGLVMAPPPDAAPAVTAQTPAAAAALASRQASIAQAMTGKPLPGETKPRKF